MTDSLVDEITLLRAALDRLQGAMEDIALRGLRAAGAAEMAKLRSLADEFRTAGAGHLGDRLDSVVQSISTNDREAVVALLRAMTSARLFDRMLTLEVCSSMLDEYLKSALAEPSTEET